MLDKSFVEKIESMAAPKVIETPQGTFTNQCMSRIEFKVPDTFRLSTLSGLAAMIKHERNTYGAQLFVRITGPETVDVFGAMRDDCQRENPFTAEAVLPEFCFNTYYSIESMIIALKSKFEPTEDRDYLVKLLGNITDTKSVQTKDDGVTQSVTVNAGIQMLGETKVKPIVSLKPYRTFLEVEQPESEFLIRLREGQAALYEADGGEWRNQAMANIGDLMREMLKDTENVIVIE